MQIIPNFYSIKISDIKKNQEIYVNVGQKKEKYFTIEKPFISGGIYYIKVTDEGGFEKTLKFNPNVESQIFVTKLDTEWRTS